MLTEATRALVAVSAAIGRGDGAALATALERAARTASAGQVEEALLQSHLFVGYPAMLQALTAWRTIVPDPADDGSDDPVWWRERGERVCAQVYGGQYDRLRANVVALHPALDRWMVADGYGRVLGRPGLPLAERELCIIALLCPQNAPAQLYAHLRGALNTGASEADVDEAVTLATAELGAERQAMIAEVWRDVRGRRRGVGGG